MPAKKRFETIDQYIKTYPDEIQKVLEKMRQTTWKAAPEAEEGDQLPDTYFQVER
jgi:uncharacterized protein YdhG (YjbR/CyaY superfamily)